MNKYLFMCLYITIFNQTYTNFDEDTIQCLNNDLTHLIKIAESQKDNDNGLLKILRTIQTNVAIDIHSCKISSSILNYLQEVSKSDCSRDLFQQVEAAKKIDKKWQAWDTYSIFERTSYYAFMKGFGQGYNLAGGATIQWPSYNKQESIDKHFEQLILKNKNLDPKFFDLNVKIFFTELVALTQLHQKHRKQMKKLGLE